MNTSRNYGKRSEDAHTIFMLGFSVQEVEKGEDTITDHGKTARKKESDKNDRDVNWINRTVKSFVPNLTRQSVAVS